MEKGLRNCGLWQSVGNKRVVNERRARTLEEFDFQDETDAHAEDEISNAEGKRRKLESCLFKMHQNSISKGDQVKNAGEVLKECGKRKQPRISCRVVGFGKICQSLDDRRKKWVREMGFEGLLYLVDRCLSKDLCYWLMTRIDPINELFRASDGREYKLYKDQVRWILGIPKGDKVVPRRVRDEEMKRKVRDIEKNFGGEWEARLKTSEKVIKQKGIRVNSALIERAKGSWGEEQEAEFKTVILILALHLVLCPTQSYQLESDLIPALTCAMQAKNYDWCGLVLEKLFDSCCRFGKKFYANGYAKGFGGCSIFLAIFYLDRLDRNPVMWCRWPRIKVWTKTEMVKARDEDRLAQQGDFGNLGCTDVDYGKKHPREARDTDGTSFVDKGLSRDFKSLQSKEEEAILGRSNDVYKRKNPKRRSISAMYPESLKVKKAKRKRLQGGVPNALAQAYKIPVVSKIAGGGCPSQSVIDNSEQNSCREGEGRNEDGRNGDDGYISLAEEIRTPVATNFAVVTEPVGERRDNMPSPTNEVTVTTSHGCTEHNGMGAPSCSASSCFICLLFRCVLDFEKMHIGKDAEIKLSKNLDQTTEENLQAPPCLTPCNTLMASAFVHSVGEMHAKSTNSNYKIIPPQSNSHADHSVCFPSRSKMKGKSKLPQILNGSVEENAEGVLPCLLSSCNVMEDSGFVDSGEKFYNEEVPTSEKSENNNSLNKSLVDNYEIMPSSSLGIPIEKAIKEMDLRMEQVKKCREKCVNMSSNRSVDSVAEMHMETVPSCDKSTNLETSHDNVNEGIPSQSTHQRGVDEISVSINTSTAEIDQHEKIHEENDNFDPFKVVGSELEDWISKLEKIVSRKLASKLAFKTTFKTKKKKKVRFQN